MRFNQTKTPVGFVPFAGMERIPVLTEEERSVFVEGGSWSKAVLDSKDPKYVFDLLDAKDIERCARGAFAAAVPGLVPPKKVTLVDLGNCVKPRRRGRPANTVQTGAVPWEIDRGGMYDLAQKIGPLFGGGQGVEQERSWLYAAYVARVGTDIMSVLNGKKPVGYLRTMDRLKKASILDASGACVMRYATLRVRPYGEYADVLKNVPFMRRMGDAKGYQYAFAMNGVDPEHRDASVVFVVVSLQHELDRREFRWLCNKVELDVGEVDACADSLDPELCNRVFPNEAYTWEEEVPFDASAEDLQLLRGLAIALVYAHLSDVSLDVFLDDPETGFLCFPSYLSWMWYRMAKRMEFVNRGYCEVCGKPFSLVGQRGLRRKYCSDACKYQAKNKNSKSKKDRVRRQFLEDEWTVRQIVENLDYDTEDKEKWVREAISSGPMVKAALKDDITRNGFKGSMLLRRVHAERLNVEKLLSKELKGRLKKEVEKQGHKDREKKLHGQDADYIAR